MVYLSALNTKELYVNDLPFNETDLCTSAEIDAYNGVVINKTSSFDGPSQINISTPSPRNQIDGKTFYVKNSGIATFFINNNTINPNETKYFTWRSSGWELNKPSSARHMIDIPSMNEQEFRFAGLSFKMSQGSIGSGNTVGIKINNTRILGLTHVFSVGIINYDGGSAARTYSSYENITLDAASFTFINMLPAFDISLNQLHMTINSYSIPYTLAVTVEDKSTNNTIVWSGLYY